MEQKKVLVTCFGKFHQHKINISQCVSNQLCEMLSDNEVCKLNDNAPLVLNIHGYKKVLKQELENNQYDYVISMGLCETSSYCRLERVLLFNSKNNFIKSTNFFYRYGFRILDWSPCYRVRNLLNRLSKSQNFKWEFLHIPQKEVNNNYKIVEITNTIYELFSNELCQINQNTK